MGDVKVSCANELTKVQENVKKILEVANDNGMKIECNITLYNEITVKYSHSKDKEALLYFSQYSSALDYSEIHRLVISFLDNSEYLLNNTKCTSLELNVACRLVNDANKPGSFFNSHCYLLRTICMKTNSICVRGGSDITSSSTKEDVLVKVLDVFKDSNHLDKELMKDRVYFEDTDKPIYEYVINTSKYIFCEEIYDNSLFASPSICIYTYENNIYYIVNNSDLYKLLKFNLEIFDRVMKYVLNNTNITLASIEKNLGLSIRSAEYTILGKENKKNSLVYKNLILCEEEDSLQRRSSLILLLIQCFIYERTPMYRSEGVYFRKHVSCLSFKKLYIDGIYRTSKFVPIIELTTPFIKDYMCEIYYNVDNVCNIPVLIKDNPYLCSHTEQFVIEGRMYKVFYSSSEATSSPILVLKDGKELALSNELLENIKLFT